MYNLKEKIKKTANITGGVLFLIALAIHIKVTLDDPFVMLSDKIIAQMTSCCTNSSCSNNKSCSCSTTSSSGSSISSSSGSKGKVPTCAAGGCGATSCSFSGEIIVMGNGVTVSLSVSCSGNTWACCNITASCFDKASCG